MSAILKPIQPAYNVANGCELWTMRVGMDCEIPIEYEVDRGQPQEDSGAFAGPAIADAIMPVNAFINGYWVDVQDLFGSEGYELIAQRIAESRA